MIKIVSAHIEEFRGIRRLDVPLAEKSFVVSGPNGSGKSGVIDAIEFALTGQIGRLMGTGTRGLTLADHAPHVDMTKFPNAAFVELDLSFPTLGKSAKLIRKVSAPKKPKIEPNDPDIVEILDEVSRHPEITLARREILKFILVEPTKRSDQIQEILKIDELGQTRSALNTAFGKLKEAAVAAEKDTLAKKNTLMKHLEIASLSVAEMLGAVNARRELLGLAAHHSMTAETVIDQGLAEPKEEHVLNKPAALIELDKLTKMIAGADEVNSPDAEGLVGYIEQLEDDAQLLVSLHQRELVEHGMKLVDGPACPMCDHEWESEAHLLSHLHAKQKKSKAAGELKEKLSGHASALSTEVGILKALLIEAHRIAKLENAADMLASVMAWGKDLALLQEQLKSFTDILGLKNRLISGWQSIPAGFEEKLVAFAGTIRAKPDQSATLAAQSFLINAEQRFGDYKEARRFEIKAQKSRDAGKIAYDAWCTAMESELDALYEAVEDDFSNFYRILNYGDEQKFVARFKATAGRLDFDVNFYERGLFPPGAFHSEGHQDGMGVCLYLALMKRLLGDSFTVALLDDVVMSVDAAHRYQFCKLLMTEFPNTQFVIATHDKVWAEQMRSAKLVSRKTSMVFDSWSVEAGPSVEENPEVWAEIDQALAKDKVEVAAPILRRHMEFVARLLADQLGAPTTFRADNSYDLGGLFPSAMFKLSELLGKAVDSAQSWGADDQKSKAHARRQQLKQANTHKGEEDWTINKAVHFNEWANFSSNDFKPVVQAFKDVLACAQCDKCGSWLHITPKSSSPEVLKCPCGHTNFNLVKKPK